MEHLIPHAWFAAQSQLILLLLTLASLAVVAKGADILVEGAAGAAYRLGMPKVIVGATIVSLGTTSPEFAVSVMAAWNGNAGLALGNAVGSIIADTGLIFGLGCVLAVLPADRFVLSRQGWVQFGSAALLAAICYVAWITMGAGAYLGRPVGVVLLGLLAAYLWISVRWARQRTASERVARAAADAAVGGEEDAVEHAAHRSLSVLFGMIGIGIVLVIVSSHALIGSVGELALRWGVPQVVIAASLVALGTSLPELVIGLTSLRRGHKEILVGNVIGADILNVLFVIGGAAVAAPLPIVEPGTSIPEIFLLLHLPTMLLILLLFRAFIHFAVRRGEFRRIYGVPLLLIYLIFVMIPFFLD